MNSPTLLHRAAMEYSDLARIYKAKGKPEFFEEYNLNAWLLEKEAAMQMLKEPEDFTFKYIVIRCAGMLGLKQGELDEAKEILEAGLSANPPLGEKIEMKEVLQKIEDKLNTEKNNPKVKVKSKTITGTITSADIEKENIQIREEGKTNLRSVHVSKDLIKNLIWFYLGETVLVRTDKNEKGMLVLKNISKSA